MSKVRNIVVAGDYAYVEGGAARMGINTAILLKRYTDYNVIFFGGCGEPADELRDSGVRCVTLGLPDLLQNPSKADAFIHGIYNKTVYRKAAELFRELGPEETVLHVHAWTKVLTSAVFKAAADCGVRIFLSVHDYFLSCPNGGCYNFVRGEICTLQPMSAACVKCNCDSRNYIYKLWRCLRQRKQNRVLGGIDMTFIYSSVFQREQMHARGIVAKKEIPIRNVVHVGDRHRVHAEENEIFLLVARMVQEKGVELFCEAVTKAGVKAVAVGDGTLLEGLKKKYPEVVFPGWQTQEEIQAWREKARCFVFSSVWYEGSPLIVPETQAFGVPCIVTDCNAATDTLRDGENGFVVRADADEMAAAIRKLADDELVRRMSEDTYRGFDEEGCSPENYVKKLVLAFED